MLIMGIDTVMSECRATTSTIGGPVATLVVAWEGVRDEDRARAVLAGRDVDARTVLDEDLEPLDGTPPVTDVRAQAPDQLQPV